MKRTRRSVAHGLAIGLPMWAGCGGGQTTPSSPAPATTPTMALAPSTTASGSPSTPASPSATASMPPQMPSSGPPIDINACLQQASPQWKKVGVTLVLAWDGNALTVTKCTPVDLTGGADNCGTLTGAFPAAPGWEVQTANGTPLCRRTFDGTAQSLTCQYLLAAPPPPGQHDRPGAIAGTTTAGNGGTYSSIPVLPGATKLVVYDHPCGGDRDPNAPFTNVPLLSVALKAGAAATGSTSMTSCAADSDCVAVGACGCCGQAQAQAVNASRADDYRKSLHCPPSLPCTAACVTDMRAPKCNLGTRSCEMVPNASVHH